LAAELAEKSPEKIFCLFFRDPFARCAQISNPALGGGSFGKIGKKPFSWFDSRNQQPFCSNRSY